MTANDLLAALMGMSQEQRERNVMVKYHVDGRRPDFITPVMNTTARGRYFLLEIEL